MAEQIRGKVIIEHDTLEDSDLDLILDEDDDDTPLEGTMAVLNTSGEIVRQENDFGFVPGHAGKSFDVDAASWEGRERAWRAGAVPPPHRKNARPNRQEYNTDAVGFRLPDNDLETILSSLPPITKKPSSGSHPMAMRLLSYAMVASAAVIITWMVIGLNQDSHSHVSNISPPVVQVAAPVKSSVSEPLCNPDSPVGSACGGKVPQVVKSAENDETASVSPKDAERESSARRASQRRARQAPRRRDRDRHHPVEPMVADAVAEGENGRVSVRTLLEAARMDAESPNPENVETPGDARVDSSEAGEDAFPKLPSLPSKESVRQTMNGVLSEVKKCRERIPGRVVVELVVSGETGRVISAKAIDYVEVGAIAGQCAARAVTFAQFPRFARSSLTIKYPFDL